jgi:hypothetical protein
MLLPKKRRPKKLLLKKRQPKRRQLQKKQAPWQPNLKNRLKLFTMDDSNNNPNQINIELPEDIAEGTYSNLAIISHSNSEFVVDFVRLVPNVPKAKVKARIILTPDHAKRLMRALADNVKRYEAQFGAIDEQDQPAFPLNFSTPKAQA